MKRLAVFIGVVGFGCVQNALADGQYIYGGVAATYSSTRFNWQNVDNRNDTNPAANGQMVIGQANTNTQAGLFIGYAALINYIYLGIEGATQFGHRSAASETRDYNNQQPLHNTATMGDIYIVDFRPGWVFWDKNSLIYGIFGLNTANFNAEQQNSDGIVVQDSGPMRQNGLRLGVGYNLGLGKHFMARVEYVFTKFSDFQFSDTFPDGTETHTWQLDPYSNEVSLGLALIFNI